MLCLQRNYAVLRIVMPPNYTVTLYEEREQSLSRIEQSQLHIPDGHITLFYVVCYGITCLVYYHVWEMPIYGYDLNKVALNSYIGMTVIALRKSVLKNNFRLSNIGSMSMKGSSLEF